jgi:hypothetical protein
MAAACAMESSSSMGALSTGRDSDEEASFVFWLPGRGGGGGAASSQFVIFEEKKVTEEDGGTTIVWLLVPPFELPAPMMLYLFVFAFTVPGGTVPWSTAVHLRASYLLAWQAGS